jgi:ribose transport system permease protein
VVSLAFGAGFGAINGWGIAFLKVPPFAMTLATMSALMGIALLFRPTPGGSIPYSLTEFLTYRIVVFPVGILIMIALFVAMIAIMKNTRLGRNIYAVGGNERTAELAGINTKKVKMAVYTLAGVLTAVAGIYLTARMGTGDANLGSSYSLDSITICVLGGLSLFGGIGQLSGIIASTFVLTLLGNILNLAGVDSYWQYAIKGMILIAIVFIYAVRDRNEQE